MYDISGIQLTLRDYTENKHFTESDIMNVFPVVKHSNPRARDATKLKVNVCYIWCHELLTSTVVISNETYRLYSTIPSVSNYSVVIYTTDTMYQHCYCC